MSEEKEPDKRQNERGACAAIQLTGCAVLFIGILNAMLSFRSGAAPDAVHYALVAGGAVILGAGLLKAR